MTMGRGFGIEASVAAGVVRDVAAEAERLGYSSFWVNHPPGSQALTSLAAAASATSRIQLGVGVIPIDRHPASEIAATIEQLRLPTDRLLLGIGSGGDPKGLDRVRGGVEELRALTAAQIVISALGPKMTRLAGAVADGVLFNWFTAEFEDRSKDLLAAAAREAGRPRPLVMSYVRCGLLPQAAEKLDERSARYAAIPQYARHFERMGVSARDTCVSGPDADALQAGIAAHERVLDETVVRAITAEDSAADILELLRACAPLS
jgi:alkanesulfonate monooxygenase SsuD/methylene tetrahydromethanopterin reductase-like flavin-dependent oxidoreductase (luciferase family)